MKATWQHILAVSASVVVLFASCNNDEAEVIPRKKMAKIYAEMLVTDQWITATPGIRMIADTSLVYEPILEKYGYDSEDYRKSIDKYMDDPERFARIFRSAGEILDARIKVLQKEQNRILAMSRLPKIIVNRSLEEYAPYLNLEPPMSHDSLGVEVDSVTKIYRLVPIEYRDTLYEGPRMIVKDTLSVADSIVAADSLMKVDSLLKADSLLKPFREEIREKSLEKVVKPDFKGMLKNVKADSTRKITVRK